MPRSTSRVQIPSPAQNKAGRSVSENSNWPFSLSLPGPTQRQRNRGWRCQRSVDFQLLRRPRRRRNDGGGLVSHLQGGSFARLPDANNAYPWGIECCACGNPSGSLARAARDASPPSWESAWAPQYSRPGSQRHSERACTRICRAMIVRAESWLHEVARCEREGHADRVPGRPWQMPLPLACALRLRTTWAQCEFHQRHCSESGLFDTRSLTAFAHRLPDLRPKSREKRHNFHSEPVGRWHLRYQRSAWFP